MVDMNEKKWLWCCSDRRISNEKYSRLIYEPYKRCQYPPESLGECLFVVWAAQEFVTTDNTKMVDNSHRIVRDKPNIE